MLSADVDLDRRQTEPGLSEREAAARLANGANEVPSHPPVRFSRRLLGQVAEPMALLLLAAAAVSWLALGKRVDAVAIAAIVTANVAVALVQEGRARRALEALRQMEAPVATVRREGVARRVPAREVVPGDYVLLAAGDRVPADLWLVETASFEVDESMLTGESLPVPKDATAQDAAYAGTLAMRGSAAGTVRAIGAESRLGRIAASLDTREPQTPLQLSLRSLSTRLGLVASAIAGAVFVITLLRLGRGGDALETSFLSAAALAVAAVPEGLPTVVTVALALGVRRMAGRRAIVRKLPAVETLGSTTVILTDKTGTLTENRMRLDAVAVFGRAPARLGDHVTAVRQVVCEALALCNDATLDPPTGDPMEVALAEAVGAQELRTLRDAWPRLATIPFDADRRRMATIHDVGGEDVILVKGAPEAVLPRCTSALQADGRIAVLTNADRANVLGLAEDMAGRGGRVLALARRVAAATVDPTTAEADLTCLGLVSLRDPVRAEARDAVLKATAAGLRVVMVTGDHPGTALAVAAETGIADESSRAVTGSELASLSASEITDVRVFARIAPEQKLDLVRTFQRAGHVVAVTGDGVNDAPALRRADIGVAMGQTGSDVARETADMVVTDDNLASIVTAIEEGRGIYSNIEKVVAYLVAGNLSEVLVVIAGLLLFPELGVPLLPIQLLWINLLTDGFPALALGVDPVDRSLMSMPPRSRDRRLLDRPRLALLAGRAALIAGATVGSLAIAHYGFDEPWEHARAVAFSVLMTAHLIYAFAVRRTPGEPGQPANQWLRAAVAGGIALQALVVTVPALRPVFGTAHLTVREWALVAAAGLLPAAAMRINTGVGHRPR